MKQYYAERAKEHDKVYLKPERQEDIKKIHAYLREGFSGLNVLEVACGTGYWTQTIAESALSISASDYNSEVLDIARSRDYKISDITFFEDDAYKLSKANGAYNSGFAGFFWSHIPLNKLQEFLNCLHSKLESGAKIVFIDNAFAAGSSTPIARTDKDGNTYQARKLENGKEFEVLKNFPTEDSLREILGRYSGNIKIQFLKYYWIAEYRLKKQRE